MHRPQTTALRMSGRVTSFGEPDLLSLLNYQERAVDAHRLS